MTSYFVGQQEADNLRDLRERLIRMEALLEQLAHRTIAEGSDGANVSGGRQGL